MKSDQARAERFESIAADVYEPLQRYLRRRATAADAADVLGDALLAVWRRLDDVPDDDPLPWCYGVARRCLANHRRGGLRRERLTEKVVALRPPRDDGDPQRRIDLLDPDLDQAMNTLSEAEREIVHLWAWEQLEPREIATVLDRTPNSISVALSRVKRKLADALPDERQDRGPTGQEPGDGTVDPGEEA